MDITDKIYFSLFLKENVIIFDLYEYFGKIASDLIDYMDGWGLIKNNKVVFKTKIIENYIKNQIDVDINSLKQKIQKKQFKILFLYSLKTKYEVWNDYFDNKFKFLKICKRIFKKNHKQIFDIDNFTFNLDNKKGLFFDIPCFIPSGEEEEIILHFIKKIK